MKKEVQIDSDGLASLSPYQVPGTEYTVSVLTPDKIHNAMAALTKAWVGIEPLAMWLKTTTTDVYSYFVSLQSDISSADQNMLTTVATNAKKEIVGVAVNRKYDPTVHIHCSHPMIEALIKYLEEEYRKYYIENDKGEKVFCVDSLGVIDEAKGIGLGLYLVGYSLMVAKEQGYKLCIIEATNVYSARICEKLGMKKIVSANYDEFVCETPDGTKVKAFAGLDKAFTEALNKKRSKGDPLISAASECILFEGEIDQMLSKSMM